MASKDYPNLLIVIGASAGGLDPILTIMKRLPDYFQGTILIATHRPPDSRNLLKDLVESAAHIEVEEPIDGEKLHCTTVYVGKPADVVEVEGKKSHVWFDRDRLRRMGKIDDLFFSAAESGGRNTVGVILSGAMWDGVKGLKEISVQGGRCFAQDPLEALYPDMPQNAIEDVEIDLVASAEEIADRLIEIADDRYCRPA